MTRSRNEDSPFAPHRIRLFRFVGISEAHWVKLSAQNATVHLEKRASLKLNCALN